MKLMWTGIDKERRREFMKIYNNQFKRGDPIITTKEHGPMSWFVVWVEVYNETELGRKLLDIFFKKKDYKEIIQ